MVFLDSSVLIDYLEGIEHVVDFVDEQDRLLTSSLCLYEVLEGDVLSRGETDVIAARQAIGRVRAIDFNETLALEAARIQDRLASDGAPMPVYDLLIVASARSTGDTLAVSDSDFETDRLEDVVDVRRLDDPD